MKKNSNIHLLFVIVLFLGSSNLCASKLKNMYTERRGENGLVAFFFEKKLKAVTKTELSKDVKFDFTYVQATDSVTMLSTVSTPYTDHPNKITITTCNKEYEFVPEIIYVEPITKGLEYRLKIQLSFEEWYNMFNCSNSFIVNYYFRLRNDLASGKYQIKDWQEYRNNMLSIINVLLISTNKK